MATLTINDLPACHRLDLKAMSSIRGAGAEWVFGWIRPYVAATPSGEPVINFYQINNNYYADQMNNQLQVVNVSNSAANSNINVALAESGANSRHS